MSCLLRKDLSVTARTPGRAADLIALTRLPFHIVGILPLCFGAALAFRAHGAIDPAVFWLSLAAVMLSIAATHYNGERYDMAEDSLCPGRTPFSSGTGVALSGRVPPGTIVRGAKILALCALAAGLLLQFVLRTGPYTLVLGLPGLLSGYFYSKPPLRLVSRGVGEPLIGVCYGLLLPASGFYLQAGYIHPWVCYAALPIALATLNVIWVNEILDLPNDTAAGKRNLVVRLGVVRAKRAFQLIALVQAVSCAVSARAMAGEAAMLLFAPATAFSAAAAAAVGSAPQRARLLAGCGLAIAACVSLSLGYIALALFYVR